MKLCKRFWLGAENGNIEIFLVLLNGNTLILCVEQPLEIDFSYLFRFKYKAGDYRKAK